MASGGYRQPTNPAPVGMPGALSRRTDGGPAQSQVVPTGLPYGDAQALQAQEQTSPMSASPDTPPGASAGPALPQLPPGAAPQQMPPFGQSQRPDEPITAGLPLGAGPGPEVLPLEHQPAYVTQGPMTQMLQGLSARDLTGSLASLYQSASSQGV